MPDLLLTQFPATSAEYNSGATSAWGDFVLAIQGDITAACIERQGFSRAAAQQSQRSPTGTVPPNNVQYPDLARLATGQTGTAVDVPTPGGSPAGLDFAKNPAVPKDQQAAYEATAGRCSTESIKPFASFINALTPLQKAWSDMLAKLPSDPAVRSATDKWRACMARDGVEATTPQAFFASLDAMAAEQSRSQTLVKQPHLIKTYASCVKPLADAQDRVRTGYRKHLSDDFAPQIAELQTQMDTLVTSLSAKYGLQYGAKR